MARCIPHTTRFIWANELWQELKTANSYDENLKQAACRCTSKATERLGWPVEFKRRRGQKKIAGITWKSKWNVFICHNCVSSPQSLTKYTFTSTIKCPVENQVWLLHLEVLLECQMSWQCKVTQNDDDSAMFALDTQKLHLLLSPLPPIRYSKCVKTIPCAGGIKAFIIEITLYLLFRPGYAQESGEANVVSEHSHHLQVSVKTVDNQHQDTPLDLTSSKQVCCGKTCFHHYHICLWLCENVRHRLWIQCTVY